MRAFDPARLRFTVEATDGGARAGEVTTPRGSFPTPVFMPVGTRGVVRAVGPDDLERLGARIILGNTYHLMLRPTAELVAEMGGLHRFADWGGHLLTDSGGYQVFSLEPKVDEQGARFRSVYDGSWHHLTPERCVEIQELLGSDIAMVLDVCPELPATPAVIRGAHERTLRWAARCAAARRSETQLPVRDRAGRARPGTARRVGRHARRHRLRRLRRRRALGGGDP